MPIVFFQLHFKAYVCNSQGCQLITIVNFDNLLTSFEELEYFCTHL